MRGKPPKVLIYGLGALSGLFGAVIFSSLFWHGWRSDVIATLPLSACDVLEHPCEARLPTGEQVTLTLSPTFLPTMIPLAIEVETSNLSALSASVNFSGIEMYMGDNHPFLLRREQHHFEGKTILPVCSKEHMHWRATVFIETDRGRIAAPFEFVVHKQLPSSRAPI